MERLKTFTCAIDEPDYSEPEVGADVTFSSTKTMDLESTSNERRKSIVARISEEWTETSEVRSENEYMASVFILFVMIFLSFSYPVFWNSFLLFFFELVWQYLWSYPVYWYYESFGPKIINYTRKFSHIVRIPKFFLSSYIPSFSKTIRNMIIRFIIAQTLYMMVFNNYARGVFTFFKHAFVAQNREEDKPYTLRFQVTEDILRFAVYIVFLYILENYTDGDNEMIIFIPQVINSIGDGLAEPVGITFGSGYGCIPDNRYRTSALYYKGEWCSGSFTRSVAGSSMVFLSTIVILIIEWQLGVISLGQLYWLLGILPPAMTFTEAIAPHTNDGPFLALVGCLILFAVVELVE